jgi:transposase
MHALEINRDLSDEVLAKIVKQEEDTAIRIRLLAIRHILKGNTISQTADLFCIGTTQLRVWVHRYNDSGVEGLRSTNRHGRPPKLSPEQMENLKQQLKQRKSLDSPGYHGEDVRRLLQEEFNVEYSLPAVYVLLHRMEG